MYATQINNSAATVCKKKRDLTVDRNFQTSDKTCIRIYIWRREQLQVDFGQCLSWSGTLFKWMHICISRLALLSTTLTRPIPFMLEAKLLWSVTAEGYGRLLSSLYCGILGDWWPLVKNLPIYLGIYFGRLRRPWQFPPKLAPWSVALAIASWTSTKGYEVGSD